MKPLVRGLAPLLVLLVAGCTGAASKADRDLLEPEGLLYYFQGYHWRAPQFTDALGNPIPPPAADAGREPWFAARPVPRATYALPDGVATHAPDIVVTSPGRALVSVYDQLLGTRDFGRTWGVDYRLSGPSPIADDYFFSNQKSLGWDPVSKQVMVTYVHYTDRYDVFTQLDDFTGRPEVKEIRCRSLAVSDDEGTKWQHPPLTNWPVSCALDYGGSARLLSAPQAPSGYAPLRPPPAGGRTWVLCARTQCDLSPDNGESFRLLPGAATACPSVRPASFADGTLVASRACRGTVSVALSEDEAQTWNEKTFEGQFSGRHSSVAIDSHGVAYLAYSDARDNATYIVRSKDRFATWEGPFRVSPKTLNNVHYATVVAGDDGRVAVVYAGTNTSLPRYSLDSYERGLPLIVWHAYVSYSLDIAGEAPTFATLQTTPEEWPANVGHSECFSDFDRGVLYFGAMGTQMDAQIDEAGRLYVALPLGCTARIDCAGDIDAAAHALRRIQQTFDSQVTLFVQTRGWSLRNSTSLDVLDLSTPLPYDPRRPEE